MTVRGSWRGVWPLSFVLLLCPRLAGAQPTIVVNFGTFPSAEAAAVAEREVNWLDADTTDDTACTQCFAAVELQRYLRLMTQQPEAIGIASDDPIPDGELILIGGPDSNAATRALAGELGLDANTPIALGPQGYRIKTGSEQGRRVTVIAGGSRVGTLYGVYDLLHLLGCRWFGPGQVNEEIPHAAWDPMLGVMQKPDFLSRGFYIFEERGDTDFWLWMARNRLNDWSVQVKNPGFLRKLGFQLACGTHDAEWLFLNPSAVYPYRHAQFTSHGDMPADPYPVSPAYQAINSHVTQRLRRWLCRKHKVETGQAITRYPDQYLNRELGLVRLYLRHRNVPWATA